MPRRFPDGLLGRLGAVAVAVSLATACSSTSPAPPPGVPDDPPAVRHTSSPRPAQQSDPLAAVQGLLDRRAGAVLARDESAFWASIGPNADLRRTQRQYWANLEQLPVSGLDYAPDAASMERHGRQLELAVAVRMRLGEYDDAPALLRVAMTFREGGDGWRLTGIRPQPSGGAQPWDTGRVVVRHQPGVLGVFDPGSTRAAPGLMRSLREGVADVSTRVPRPWSRRVVLYAPSALEFMASLDHVPGGDPSAVDAVTFSVPGAGAPAGHRIVLNPRLLDTPGPERDRLVRHEVAHVAMGELGPAVPSWLAEGIAEYVSVQAVPPDRRGLSPEVLNAVRGGLDGLPLDAGFDGDRSAANYGIAWWACETIARSWGEPVLWSLLDAYDRADPADRPGVLRRVLGVGERQLVRDTARLVQQQYLPVPGPGRRGG